MIKTINGKSYKLVSVETGACEHCVGIDSNLCYRLWFSCFKQKHLAWVKADNQCGYCLFYTSEGKCLTDICAKTI
jgi:hypothetical protein